jgi:DNA-binding protein HU-beta
MSIKGKIPLESIIKSAERCSRGSRAYDITIADARALVDAMFALIKGEVAEGKRVHVPGFGVFQKTSRRPRKVRHPKTGKTVDIPAFWLVRLKASKLAKGTT